MAHMAHGQYLILCDLLSAAEIVMLMGQDPGWELPLNSLDRVRRMERACLFMKHGVEVELRRGPMQMPSRPAMVVCKCCGQPLMSSNEGI
jgi:hypothetical protein